MRILHTMLRVGNLDRALDFYTQGAGHAPAAQG
jgi:catechol 2,3-dioxygenase-like lactoylglutathione lyase family enzyme